MSSGTKPPSDAHNRHHAKLRRERRNAANEKRGGRPAKASRTHRPAIAAEGFDALADGRVFLYGLHTVREALLNERRIKHRLMVTANARARLDVDGIVDRLADTGMPIEEATPRHLDRLVGSDAVHQGCVLEAQALMPRALDALGDTNLVLVLDQVTDPHNVGAIMRSAVALGAGALITTARHSPAETGVLAKSASGALDCIDHITVRNLAEALETLNSSGFQTIGLDSEGPQPLENTVTAGPVAIVLGSEGKGLRQKTRETCSALARIDMPGAIKSLNVSNAAVLALYIARSLQGD